MEVETTTRISMQHLHKLNIQNHVDLSKTRDVINVLEFDSTERLLTLVEDVQLHLNQTSNIVGLASSIINGKTSTVDNVLEKHENTIVKRMDALQSVQQPIHSCYDRLADETKTNEEIIQQDVPFVTEILSQWLNGYQETRRGFNELEKDLSNLT